MQYLILKMDDENGYGSVTPATEKLIDQLIAEEPLLALDVLKDWHEWVESKYAEAYNSLLSRGPSNVVHLDIAPKPR